MIVEVNKLTGDSREDEGVKHCRTDNKKRVRKVFCNTHLLE